jgi:hypothetical protein
MYYFISQRKKYPTVNLSHTTMRVGFTVVYMEWWHSVILLKACFHYSQYVVNMVKVIQKKRRQEGWGT